MKVVFKWTALNGVEAEQEYMLGSTLAIELFKVFMERRIEFKIEYK